ncbi:MAG: patatin-like protein, partial [Micromonosporaceae bacterium]
MPNQPEPPAHQPEPAVARQPEPAPAHQPEPVAVPQPEPAVARQPEELRIAVAMRGGVSLAVWMGGACSEIVRLRNAARDGDDPYSRLLELLDYETVTVDVISGTSAGGLNGALLALNLAYGMPFGDRVRNLWLRVGDLERLTRSPSAGHPPSLLKGDEKNGFYGELAAACHELLNDAPADYRAAPFIRLVLTATRLHPRTLRVHQTLGEPLHASNARAYFRFQHRAVNGSSPILTDFPADQRASVTDRLAYAARTTSSFPGAFAPARIWVDDHPDSEPDRRYVGQSSETGAGDDGEPTVELIDGGVLDNIPIAWAIRAIAAAPASQPVDRWLVYLQPIEPQAAPPEPTLDETGTQQGMQRRVTRLVRLLLATLTRRMDSESLLDDAEELHQAAATAQRLRGLAAGGIPPDPDDVLDDDRRADAYRRLVGLAEGARLADLMQDPANLLGPDPLDLPRHRPRIDPDILTGLADATIVGDLALPGPGLAPEKSNSNLPGVRGPLALARTVALLLDWVRAAESYGQLPEQPAKQLRDTLYSARLATELLVGLRDRMALRHFDDPDVETAADLVELVRRATWRLADGFDAEWRIPDRTSWRAWKQRMDAIVAAPLTGDVPAGWPEQPYDRFWDELAALGVAVGQALRPDVKGPPGFDVLRTTAVGVAPPPPATGQPTATGQPAPNGHAATVGGGGPLPAA